MDKVLRIKEWFLNNNLELKSNYDELLLNILMFYAKAIFTAENNNIVPYNVLMTKEGLFLEGVEEARDDSVPLDKYEIHTLKIINRMYGYINPVVLLNTIYKSHPFVDYLSDYVFSYVKLSDKEIQECYESLAYELESTFNGYDFNEKIIKINKVYFFMSNSINLTSLEIKYLESLSLNEGRTYNLYRDSNGRMVFN